MNESLKVQPHHLERAAYLYVRQALVAEVAVQGTICAVDPQSA
jgi:hypothetical protein